ncbi:unnamed protein product [Schistosoma curassoni]|uniref:NTF2 domain-containing protein n=1 Tax=Schistosoma curassoni TaxID=6186 RepID=A0A183JEL9_9TREM|nr:unnamed protein product [Schistosoma curassoni]
MVHSLIQCTLSVPKELYMFQKDQLTLHGTVHNTKDDDNDNGNKIPKSDENNGKFVFTCMCDYYVYFQFDII